MRVEIRVSLKPGVVDAEGKNTLKAIQLQGFKGVDSVGTSKVYVIEMSAKDPDEAKKMGEEISRALLANPVIHDYSITVKG
jgi:phosphoribosylformylglycinamidine synthase